MKKPALEDKKLLTVIEAAELFQLSRRKLFRLAEQENLDFLVYYGTRKLIIQDVFKVFLTQQGRREELKNGKARTKRVSGTAAGHKA